MRPSTVHSTCTPQAAKVRDTTPSGIPANSAPSAHTPHHLTLSGGDVFTAQCVFLCRPSVTRSSTVSPTRCPGFRRWWWSTPTTAALTCSRWLAPPTHSPPLYTHMHGLCLPVVVFQMEADPINQWCSAGVQWLAV